MKKNKVVVFYHDDRPPRVFTNPKSLAILQEEGDILVNPNLPKGVSPEHWRLVNGKIRGPVTIEKAFPENKLEEPRIIRWFKPFVISSFGVLFYLEAVENKEVIIKTMESLKSFILEALS